MSYFRSNVRFDGGERHVGERTVQYFKARNDGSGDNLQPFTDGFAELAAEGGGDLYVPRGYYRFTNGFTVPQGVNLRLAKAAVLQLDHATADFITLNTDNSATETVISGGILEALVANSGRVIYDPAGGGGRSWLMDSVSINTLGAQFRGILLNQLGTSSIRTVGCTFRGANLTNGSIVQQNNANAYLSVEGGSIVAPAAAWNGSLLASSAGRGLAQGVRFDLTPTTTTGAAGFRLTSSQSPWQVKNNLFTAPAFSVNGLRWSAGAHLVEHGNIFVDGSFPAGAYDTTNGELAAGSRLELNEAFATTEGAVSSITVPKGYRTVNMRRTGTGAVQIALPEGWFVGQTLLLTFFNDTGSGVIVNFATVPVTAATPGTVAAGSTMTGVLVWEDRDAAGGITPGSRWVQKGDWGFGGTLV